MSTPAWAAALGRGLDPDLVVAVLTAATARGAGPDRQRAVLAERLADGQPTRAEDVIEDLLRGSTRGQSAVSTDDAATALIACGARLLVAGAPGYPPRLAEAWPELGAPAWLFVRAVNADLEQVFASVSIAVVGTRRATLHGRRTAHELASFLAERGATVVSGMARGIDQAAHQGALCVDAPTVAVLGAGFGADYPRGTGELREAVAAAGALVTEYLPGVQPRPEHFLWRNRIISGLSDSVVVVEGRERSGALHTARLAAAQGRDVFAVPGSLLVPVSRGPLELVRDGAQLLTRFEDVLPSGAQAASPRLQQRADALTGLQAAVFELLGAVPASPRDLASTVGGPISRVLAAIAELEAAGLALPTPNGVVAVPATLEASEGLTLDSLRSPSDAEAKGRNRAGMASWGIVSDHAPPGSRMGQSKSCRQGTGCGCRNGADSRS